MVLAGAEQRGAGNGDGGVVRGLKSLQSARPRHHGVGRGHRGVSGQQRARRRTARDQAWRAEPTGKGSTGQRWQTCGRSGAREHGYAR